MIYDPLYNYSSVYYSNNGPYPLRILTDVPERRNLMPTGDEGA